jgi:hypothetical protein
MLRLRIESQPARLGLEIGLPQVEIQRVRGVPVAESAPPLLDIEIDYPRVELDAEAAMAEIGLKRSLAVARDLAAAGQKAAYESIARWARQGDELAAIEKGVSVADLAEEIAWPGDRQQINVDVAPKSRVEVNATGSISITGVPGRWSLAFEPDAVDVMLRPGAVRAYLMQKAAITISVVGDRYSVLG